MLARARKIFGRRAAPAAPPNPTAAAQPSAAPEMLSLWQRMKPQSQQQLLTAARNPNAKVAVMKNSAEDLVWSGLVARGLARTEPFEAVMPGQPAALATQVSGYSAQAGCMEAILDTLAGLSAEQGS